MRMSRLVSVSYCLAPREAVAISEKLKTLPDITKEGLDSFNYIYDMANAVKSGDLDEFSLIVRVARD